MNLSGETFKMQNGRDFPWRLEKKKKDTLPGSRTRGHQKTECDNLERKWWFFPDEKRKQRTNLDICPSSEILIQENKFDICPSSEILIHQK